MLLNLVVDQVRIVHVGTEGHGPVRVECVVWIDALADELGDRRRVVETINATFLVARQEAVVGNDDGQAHVRMLPNPDSRKVQVVSGLRVARHQDDPAGIEYKVDVRVVAADVEWT